MLFQYYFSVTFTIILCKRHIYKQHTIIKVNTKTLKGSTYLANPRAMQILLTITIQKVEEKKKKFLTIKFSITEDYKNQKANNLVKKLSASGRWTTTSQLYQKHWNIHQKRKIVKGKIRKYIENSLNSKFKLLTHQNIFKVTNSYRNKMRESYLSHWEKNRKR